MDHHSMMWNAASADIAAEAAEAALTYALADLSGVQGFTHLAASAAEYAQRAALSSDRVQEAAQRHGADPQAVQAALDRSFGYVLAARTATAQPAPAVPAATAPTPPTPVPEAAGAPASARTSKPRTMPTGGVPPTPPTLPVPTMTAAAPAPGPVQTPGVPAQAPAVSPKAASVSRLAAIAADIAMYNPHLPEATIARLSAQALRHLAAEPLAYGNWSSQDDGPITDRIKNMEPGKKKPGGSPGSGGAGLSGDGDGDGDDSPSGGSAAASGAAEVVPEAESLLAVARR